MTPSKPMRGEIVGAFGCGMRWRGFARARWYSRCRSFDVTSTYRIVISGSAWPSNFMSAGKVTLERIISLAYVCLKLVWNDADGDASGSSHFVKAVTQLADQGLLAMGTCQQPAVGR